MQALSDPGARTVVASRRRAKRRRTIRRIALLLIVLGAGCCAFLGSRSGKSLLLRSVAASIRARFGVEARAAALDYRLAAGGVTIYGVSVTEAGATRPFFSADRVELDFSAGIVLGRFALRRLDVSRPDIAIDPSPHAAARSIPPGAGPARTLPSFDIRRVDVRDLALTIGRSAGTQFALRGVSLALAGDGPGRLHGELVVAQGGSVRHAGAAIGFDRARAEVALAGTWLSLASIAVNSPVAALGATARLDITRGDLDVTYDAHLDLGQVHQWWVGAPSVSGALEARGTIVGTVEEPVATFAVKGERLRWREITDAAISVSGRWSGAGDLVLDRYDVSSRGADTHAGGRASLSLVGEGRASTLRVEARAGDPRRLALQARVPAPPSVPVTLVADVGWPGSIPRTTTLGGSVHMVVLDARTPGASLATIDASGQRGRWTIRPRGTLDGGTRIAADVSVVADPATLSHSTIEGRIAAESSNVAAAIGGIRRRGYSWPNVDGMLQGGRALVDGTLSGTLASPRIQARATADSLSFAGLDDVHAEAEVSGGGTQIEISRMTVAVSGNRIDVRGIAPIGAGPLDVSVDGRLEGPAAVARWLPADWRPAGALILSGRLVGSLRDPHFAGRVSRSGVDIEQEDITGTIGLAHGWPFEVHARLRKSPLAPLVALVKIPAPFSDTTGTVTASADVAGRLERPRDSSVVLTLSQLDGQSGGKPLKLVQPGRVRFEGRRPIVEEPLQLAVGGFSIGLAPGDGDDDGDGLVTTIEGRIEDALALLPANVADARWRAEGPVRARIAMGRAENGGVISGDGDATLERLVRSGRELARDVRLRARLRNDAIEIFDTAGTALGGPFTGTARVPIAWAFPSWLSSSVPAGSDMPPAALSARADVGLTGALQALGVTRTDVSGSAKVVIEARASAPRLDSVDATVAMSTAELTFNKITAAQERPTTLRFSHGRVEIGDLAWKGPRSTLTAAGAVGLLSDADGELRIDGRAALAPLLAVIAPGAAGDAAFQVRVSGPPGSRRTSANVALSDVTLIEPKRQLALAGLSGTITLDQSVLEARDLRGQLNGGDLRIDGAIAVRAGVAAPRPLKIEGRGLFVEIPRGLRSQLDTSLTWETLAAGPRVSGQVSIASDSYRAPITELAQLAASLSSVSPSGPVALPPWIAATAMDIRIDSIGPIVVDQSVLKIELLPDVRLTGTVGRPALGGQVAIQDGGRIQAGGRTYRLTESRLEFSPRLGLLPRLNVLGETRVSSYLVTLRITGPANEIETNFSSDPPLGERDVRSLLVTGQTADPARRSDGDRFAIGAVSGDVLGIAGQFVGLDSIRVGTEDLDLVSSDVNPATRLTVSKRLGDKFELVVSQNLEESQSTWIVIYRPIAGYEFRVSSEDNTTQGFEFRQEITFGPGVSPHARVRSVAMVADTVRSVTLVGEPGFPPSEVLDGTKTRAGDRFDFRQWLDDRDRIVRFYTDRGYFTARVVPMRTAGEATGKARPVDLQYRITRGPRTLLELSGYSADEQLVERLRQTWSDNVLPDLLGDRLARATRDHLADAGFLRARVETDVDRSDPRTARARVRIQPGARTGSRRLAFTGNQVIRSEQLEVLASSLQPGADPWKDATRLIGAIQADYAAKGYLSARATAEPIEFSNGAATLPIRIDEGPQAHVAALNVTGVAADRRSEALVALGVRAGAPFALGVDRAARSRLERYYRDLGYRDVHVDVTVNSEPRGPGVLLTFAVQEGPQHIVRSVEISGVQSTRASLVSDAVGVAPGQPAGLAVAAAAERRLYELGTLRRAEVRFEPETGPTQVPGTVPVTAIVSVEEARRFQLRYGVELSSEYNSALSQRANALGFAGDIRDRNFLGRGMSLGGGLRYEPDLRSARTLFSVPKLASRPIRTNVYLTARGEEDTSDEQVTARDDEVELAIEQRWRVGRAVEYSWGYTADWRDTRLSATSRAKPLVFSGTLASLNAAAVIDRRDSFFDAKRGWFGSVSTQWGQRAFGSDVDYVRTLVRGSYYHPVGPTVAAGNVRWGRLLPLGGEPPLTAFDLFFNAGGTESVRGYSQDELAGYEFVGAPLGGTKLLVFNGELRAPLVWRLGGVVFADAGNTFRESQPIRLGDLAVGIGVGLRINTPLAPVRIDLGFPQSLGKSGFRWHFSIGQMF